VVPGSAVAPPANSSPLAPVTVSARAHQSSAVSGPTVSATTALSSTLAAALSRAAAATPAGSVPAAPASLPRLPVAGPGGGPVGGGTGSASGGHGGQVLSGRASLDRVTHRTLIVVRRVRSEGAMAIWRSFLPEVPPA
jgi:hypothetical protein